MVHKPSIFFIHGAIVTSSCWDEFISFFETKGYATSAPPWPYKDASAKILRERKDPGLAGLGLGEILAHYETLLKNIPEPPILIGHSFGGLFVQMLRSKGYGCGSISIDSAPPRGVFSFYPTTLRGMWPNLKAGITGKKIFLQTFEDFSYGFVNSLDEEDQRAVYEKYVAPETSRIFLQAAMKDMPGATSSNVDFAAHPEIPLLMIGGGNDHLCPDAMTRANWRRYRNTEVRADYQTFNDATHWIISQPGVWEEVASASEEWIRKISTPAQVS